MGVFEVPIRVRNWLNPYLPEDQRGEEITCQALVDSGAVQMCLPAELVRQLRLVEVGRVRAYTADGQEHDYRLMGIGEVEVQGRSWRGQIIEIPEGARALLGAVPLEEMDWHISLSERRLLPNPRSPEGPLLPLVSSG